MRTMDSWLFGGSERITFGLSDGGFPSFDSTSLTKEMPSEWGMGSSCNSDRSALDMRQGIVENPTIIESGFQAAQEITLQGSVKDFVENGAKEPVANSCSSFSTKSSSGEKEEGSKDSSSIVDPDANDSFIDLKLGRLSEQRILEDSKSSNGVKLSSERGSPAPAKRFRSAGSNGQTPLCQVQGCNMDLSCFKDYYKRHRVCQIHSKTPKVIVKGIQQRFCQQCSRFHLLSEFDDGKRSCRKRLAGHNERRRKPQIVFQSGKSGMMPPYHGGGNFLETDLPGKTPFLFQSGIAQSGGYQGMNCSRLEGLDNSLTGIQMPTVKEISFVDEGITLPAGIYDGYASRQHCGVSGSNSTPDIGITDKGCTGASDSNCARSLLSSQSANLCSYPLSRFANDPAGKNGSNSTGLSLQELTNSVCSSGIDGQVGSVPGEMRCCGGLVEEQRYFLETSFGGRDVGSSQEHDHTINLLQLSSLLQDAESRKRSFQVKQELEPFVSLPIL